MHIGELVPNTRGVYVNDLLRDPIDRMLALSKPQQEDTEMFVASSLKDVAKDLRKFADIAASEAVAQKSVREQMFQRGRANAFNEIAIMIEKGELIIEPDPNRRAVEEVNDCLRHKNRLDISSETTVSLEIAEKIMNGEL
jgi:hypothetical protein